MKRLIIEVVMCEGCGRQTALYPSERALLEEHPRLNITCEQCVEAFRRDPLAFVRKRVGYVSGSAARD